MRNCILQAERQATWANKNTVPKSATQMEWTSQSTSSKVSSNMRAANQAHSKKYYDPRVWVREGEKTMTKRVEEALADFNTANQV